MKKQVTLHPDILWSCQMSLQTDVLWDTDLCYNVSGQSIWILKAKYKEREPQPAVQQWSLVWSKQSSVRLGQCFCLLAIIRKAGMDLIISVASRILAAFSITWPTLAQGTSCISLWLSARQDSHANLAPEPCLAQCLQLLAAPASPETPTHSDASQLRSSSQAAFFPRSLSTGFHNAPVIQLALAIRKAFNF